MAVARDKLSDFLRQHTTIGLDTSVFIFQVEQNLKYLNVVDPIFAWLEGPRTHAVTSTITMLELLVQPYRVADIDRVNRFYALLATFPHLVAPKHHRKDLYNDISADKR